MLYLNKLAVSLGDRHWQFDLKLETHGVHALMGRSGSGKSTLLNLIGGFLEPASGDIVWQEQSLLNLQPAQRPITTLFQQHNLFNHLSVWQNVALGIAPDLKVPAQLRNRIDEVLDSVGLYGYARKTPPQLSGGEQQRVALARCLLRRQPLLLLDEPFSALDATTRAEMIALLRALIEEFKPCVVMITHDEDDAIAVGANVLRMQDDGISSPGLGTE